MHAKCVCVCARTDLCVHSFAPVLQEMNEKNPKLLSAEAVIVMGIQNLCRSHLERQNKRLNFYIILKCTHASENLVITLLYLFMAKPIRSQSRFLT